MNSVTIDATIFWISYHFTKSCIDIIKSDNPKSITYILSLFIRKFSGFMSP